jgi:hypothetical protein
MKLLRSWPANLPPSTDRAHVTDTIPRLYLSDYDYAPLVDVDDDVVLIEWDIAIDKAGLVAFVARAKANPDRVIVAPYRLFETTVKSEPLRKPVWCHRRADRTHVDTGEKWCALFGFGLIYFPRDLVQAYHRARPGHFSDGSFSTWHEHEVSNRVEIIWEAQASHLHYKIQDLGFDAEEHDLLPTDRREPSASSAADDDLAATRAEGYVSALLRERASYKRAGSLARVIAVDEQLEAAGYGA